MTAVKPRPATPPVAHSPQSAPPVARSPHSASPPPQSVRSQPVHLDPPPHPAICPPPPPPISRWVAGGVWGGVFDWDEICYKRAC